MVNFTPNSNFVDFCRILYIFVDFCSFFVDFWNITVLSLNNSRFTRNTWSGHSKYMFFKKGLGSLGVLV